MDNIQVIYITGVGRSGSTVLDRVLGTLPGVSSFNEIYRLFLEGFEENNLCTCGERFLSCPFWKMVVERSIDNSDQVRRLMSLQEKLDHSRYFLKLYSGIYSKDFAQSLAEYREWLKRLYFAIAETSGNKILVDSSKVPSRAMILHGTPGIDVHAVHAVRDLRAVVNAWQKEKFNPAVAKSLPIFSPLRSVTFWSSRNIFSEMLGRRMPYQRVLYEAYASKPKATLQGLVDNLKPLSGKKLEFITKDSIKLGGLHSIGGNPDRFSTGET